MSSYPPDEDDPADEVWPEPEDAPPRPPWRSRSRPAADRLDDLDPNIPVVLLRPAPPHPGFWWSVFWCALFLIAQVGVSIVATVVAVVLQFFTKPGLLEKLQQASRAGASS